MRGPRAANLDFVWSPMRRLRNPFASEPLLTSSYIPEAVKTINSPSANLNHFVHSWTIYKVIDFWVLRKLPCSAAGLVLDWKTNYQTYFVQVGHGENRAPGLPN